MKRICAIFLSLFVACFLFLFSPNSVSLAEGADCEAVYRAPQGMVGTCQITVPCDGYYSESTTPPLLGTRLPSEADGEPCSCACKMGNPLGKGGCLSHELSTAIGCIPIGDSAEIVGYILRWAIGIGGGIAFLLIILASFQISTSSGNPDRLKAGQELLTSAISGLIMLVFSIFILQLIGVQILNLPGFR